MVPSSHAASKQRSERRIAVRLPMQVKGRDARGLAFEEDTASDNLCRNGAGFRTRLDVAVGMDLEIRIPLSSYNTRRRENDFATYGRVVHVGAGQVEGEKVVGVQFIGPRFQRVFQSESAA